MLQRRLGWRLCSVSLRQGDALAAWPKGQSESRIVSGLSAMRRGREENDRRKDLRDYFQGPDKELPLLRVLRLDLPPRGILDWARVPAAIPSKLTINTDGPEPILGSEIQAVDFHFAVQHVPAERIVGFDLSQATAAPR